MSGWMKIFVLTIVLIGFGLIPSCKKEDIRVFNLVSIVANGLDLKASPGKVAVSTVITATFTADIDPGSLTFSGVIMTRDYDTANVVLTLIVSKRILSIRSSTDLIAGASYTLTINSTLRSSNGLAFQSFTGTFRTIGTFVPPGQKAYWSFEGTPDDVIGNYDPPTTDDVILNDYVDSRNAESGKAASFDGKTSIIQIPGGSSLLGPEFTITFWMFLISDNHQDASGNQKGSYVFGIGDGHGLQFDVHPNYDWCRISHGLLLSDGTTTTSDFQFYANGRKWNNLQNEPDSIIKKGIDNYTTVNQDFGAAGLKSKLDKKWAQVAFSFDDSTKTRSLFINGELMYRQKLSLPDTTVVLASLRPLVKATSLKFVSDTNIPQTYDDKLAFGFRQSKDATFGGISAHYGNPDANHFQGWLDDVRIFSRSLTDLEISLIYQGEKP